MPKYKFVLIKDWIRKVTSEFRRCWRNVSLVHFTCS